MHVALGPHLHVALCDVITEAEVGLEDLPTLKGREWSGCVQRSGHTNDDGSGGIATRSVSWRLITSTSESWRANR